VKSALHKFKGSFLRRRVDCDALDGKVVVRGLSVGYDEFTVALDAKGAAGAASLTTSMFVAVFEEIVPKHPAVAIAIAIADPFTMEWAGGPLPWPRKEALPVDAQFVHSLQVSVARAQSENTRPIGNVSAAKDFGFRFDRNSLEFMCYRQFHGTVTLSVSNAKSESLPQPTTRSAEIEVYCFPQFRYDSNLMEMGVGTRKNAKELYPEWVSSAAAKEFEILIDQKESEVVSVMDTHKVQAKRLGQATITGQLVHPQQRVHVHRPGFENTLNIIVLFKGFTMAMPAHWVIEGHAQVAHIEGLDGEHHILPNRQNFDDVHVQWTSEDPNIVQLAPILPRPDAAVSSAAGDGVEDERLSAGTGLSVLLVAHSVGQCNVKAVVTLRNPPKKIKAVFQLTQTVTVLPRVVTPSNTVILKRNSSTALPAALQPDCNVDSLGAVYEAKHDYSGPAGTVFVEEKKLRVSEDARAGDNVVVTLVLQSPDHDGRGAHRVQQYPLNQAASLIVSIVEPTGLSLLSSPYGGSMKMDNAVYTQSVRDLLDGDQPFWTTLSSAQRVRNVDFSRTENVMCERQSVVVKVSILDELARELHAMEQCKAVSNDSAIVAARKEIQIGTDRVGGAVYAAVQLDALQPGFATITFQGEKDPLSVAAAPSPAQSRDFYVNDDPTFLRTFLTIRVLSAVECEAQFGVHFVDSGSVSRNDSAQSPQRNDVRAKPQQQQQDGRRNAAERARRRAATATVALEKEAGWRVANRNAIGALLVAVLVVIVGCGWNTCCAGNGTLNPAVGQSGLQHAAQFDPIRSLNLGNSVNNPYSQRNSFQM